MPRAALALLLALGCLWAARGVQWRESLLELLPEDEPLVAAQLEVLRHFRSDRLMPLIVHGGDEAGRLAVAERLALLLRAELEAEEYNLQYRSGPAQTLALLEALRARRAGLFTEDDARALTPRLEYEALRRALEGWKRRLATNPAPGLTAQLARDPVGLDALLLAKLEALRPGGERTRFDGAGRLRVGEGVLLLLRGGGGTLSGGAAARDFTRQLGDIVRRAEAADPTGGARVAWPVGPRFASENASRIRADLGRSLSLATAGILLLAWLALRRPWLAPLALGPALFGAALAGGALAFFAPRASAVAVGCGAMLLGIAVDYGIHVLLARDRHPRGPLPGGLGRALALGAATTATGFAVLAGSAMPAYRDLGLFAAVGVVGAAGFSWWVLPGLVPGGEARRERPRWSPEASHRWLARRLIPLRIPLLLGLTLAALAALPGLRLEGDPQALNGASRAALEDLERLRDLFGESHRAQLTLEGPGPEAVRIKARRAWQALEGLREAGLVESLSGPLPLLPDPRNRARWRAFWSEERLAALELDLARAARDTGFRPAFFEPFLASLREEEATPSGDDALDALLEDWRSTDAEASRLRLEFRPAPGVGPESFREALGPDAAPAHGPWLVAAVQRWIFSELARRGGLALAAVALLLALVLRRQWRRLPLYLAPPLLTLLWTLGALAQSGMALNLVNAAVFVFLFGLVVDYAIFLMPGPEDSDAERARRGGAVLLSAATTLVGLGSLALATHPALRAMGLTGALGVAGAWLAVILLAPPPNR